MVMSATGLGTADKGRGENLSGTPTQQRRRARLCLYCTHRRRLRQPSAGTGVWPAPSQKLIHHQKGRQGPPAAAQTTPRARCNPRSTYFGRWPHTKSSRSRDVAGKKSMLSAQNKAFDTRIRPISWGVGISTSCARSTRKGGLCVLR